MHCVDCHFEQDVHGNGKIYGEYPERDRDRLRRLPRHDQRARHAARPAVRRRRRAGTNLARPASRPRASAASNGSATSSSSARCCATDLEWEVIAGASTVIDPASPHYNEKARLAKTMQKDGKTWGDVPEKRDSLAHGDDKMACYTCHTSWVTSCFGCHLPQQANWKKSMQHFEGGETRNWTSYNPQVIRHDIFMLGAARHGEGQHHRPGALVERADHQHHQRQPRAALHASRRRSRPRASAARRSTPHFAHTVRAKETRECTDCHVSAAGDNNAWMAQVLTLGHQLRQLHRPLRLGRRRRGTASKASP